MGDNTEYTRSLQNITDTLKQLLNYFLKKWWLLVLIMLVGATLGMVYFFMQKPKFEAETTFILEEKSGGNNGLAGLASQFGFNVGGLSGGGMFSGDNILTILESKKVVEEVLLSEVDSAKNGESLADYYIEFTGIRKKWDKKPALATIHFSNLNGQLTPIQDSLLNRIYRDIIDRYLETGRTAKQSSIISVRVTAADGTFARLLSERLVDATAKLYLEVRVGTAQRNIAELQKRSDSLLFLLNNKSYSTAASQPLDINPGIRTATVPVEIATRDKTVLATLYAEVVKNLEASKLILSQQTPVVELLDKPGYLLQDKRKGLFFLMVVLSAILEFLYVAAAAVLFLFFGVGGIKNKPV